MAVAKVGNIQGPPGTTGSQGPAGAPGDPGVRGTYWFVGSGEPPDPYPGSIPGDLYLESETGDVYQLS